jgi:DNA-binding response OmpR family regulator
VRILVIDDNALARRLVGQVLRHAGHHVIDARDGDVALARLSEERVDLIITDVLLPGDDGVQLLPKLRSMAPNVPVLAVTGLDADDLRGAGFDDVVQKPVAIQPLVEAVGRFAK